MDPENPRVVLYNALRLSGMAHMATILVRLQIASLDDLLLHQELVLNAGVHQWQLERVLAQMDPLPQTKPKPTQRGDIPVMRPHMKRASLTLALAAAAPNNRTEAMQQFEQDILARSTNPSQESRVRTYRAICKAWGIPAFPMSLETIRCFGASMKAGHYRSVALYYQAAIGFQARHLETPIEPFLRGAIKDAIRSVRRGLGPSSLKESFDPMELLTIPITDTVEPFDAQKVHHMLDVTIIALWFMMREIEIAASKLQHLTLDDQSVHLTIPSSKTDTIGQWTSRTLRCACRYQIKSLCPWHAAYRHLRRVRVHPTFRNSQDFPLVPNIDGTIMTKPQIISSLRGLLEAAGIPVTRQDESGNSLPRFGGHAFRVSGAQMLGAGGVPLQLIQLLGRWSSMAIQRYVQQSHLAVVPSVPEQLLNNRPSQLLQTEASTGSVVAQTSQAVSPTTPPGRDLPPADNQPVPSPCRSSTRWRLNMETQNDKIDDLAKQVADLTLALAPPAQSFVVRKRSNIVHQGFTYETYNQPSVWKTPCGWSYGCSNFFRVPVVDTTHVKCKKCFNIDDTVDSSDSEGHDQKDDVSSSDSSSSEEEEI